MARPIVLVDSQPSRLALRRRLVEEAGAVALVASTLAQACLYLSKIRVRAVLTEAHRDDGHSAALLRAMRDIAAYENVPLIVLGSLTVEERADIAGDPRVYALEGVDAAVVLPLLMTILAAPRTTDEGCIGH